MQAALITLGLLASSCTTEMGGPDAGGGTAGRVQAASLLGYLVLPQADAPVTFNAGFTLYVAAWPLLKSYPGNRFNSGLPSTWMFAQYPGAAPADLYSDIEGGLGWWEDTRFATETPKFIMGGVAYNFSEWANGPGAGADRDWSHSKGKYGVAQLSPWLLWPPDGLNLKQGTNGELFGYGYLPLPLSKPKSVTAGANVPTGENCWTLFVQSGNFKGPVAFFLPYFWSHPSVAKPELAGLFLDSRASDSSKGMAMETHFIPAYQSTDAKGDVYARIAPIMFPRSTDDTSVVVHRHLTYSKSALWDPVAAWFDGGPASTGAMDPSGSFEEVFGNEGAALWEMAVVGSPTQKAVPVDLSSVVSPAGWDSGTYALRWSPEWVEAPGAQPSHDFGLPEYFHLVAMSGGLRWVAVHTQDVPAETRLAAVEFKRAPREPTDPYVTPEEPQSSWKTPGPVAGPFQTRLGDGSTVTYFWYRFADQPALLNADLTAEEREAMQRKVEKLHRAWTKERAYFPLPSIGALAEVDAALLVTPPKGFEIGYVPIATWQGIAP